MITTMITIVLWLLAIPLAAIYGSMIILNWIENRQGKE